MSEREPQYPAEANQRRELHRIEGEIVADPSRHEAEHEEEHQTYLEPDGRREPAADIGAPRPVAARADDAVLGCAHELAGASAPAVDGGRRAVEGHAKREDEP